MADKAQLETALRNAHAAGDTQAAKQLATTLKGMNKDSGFMDTAGGFLEGMGAAGETAMAMGSGMIAEPVAGLAGIGAALNPFAEEGAGARTVANVKKAMTYQPRGEAGQEMMQDIGGSGIIQGMAKGMKSAEQFTGDIGYDLAGPTGGALLSALPTAALELAGVGAPVLAGKAIGKLANRSDLEVDSLGADIDAIRSDIPNESGIKETAEAITPKNIENVADAVQPDPAFYQALEDLDISAEPLAAMGSQNPQYQALEMGLASLPQSPLDGQARAFIKDVSRGADDLIERYGGTTDKDALSMRFREDSLRAIDDIYEAESGLYDAINANIDNAAGVRADNITGYLHGRIRELGGMEEFAKQKPRLAKMYKQLNPKKKTKRGEFSYGTGRGASQTVEALPTYAMLNSIRKEIGQQLGRKADTSFKKEDVGELKKLYSEIKKDQRKVAADNNMSESVAAGDALTIQRKQLEDNTKTLLGKDLAKDLMPEMGKAIRDVKGGNIEKFKRTIEALPEGIRQEALVSSLNDVFKGSGQGKEAFSANDFAKFMNQMDRNPGTKKLLYDNLPAGTGKAMNDLYTVSKGINSAYSHYQHTGKALDIYKPSEGLINKMMEGTSKIAAAKMAGPMGYMAVNDFLKQSSRGSRATSDLMGSRKFQEVLKKAVREGVVEGKAVSKKTAQMESAIEKSAKFRDWERTLSNDARVRLSSVGLVNYLLEGGPEEVE